MALADDLKAIARDIRGNISGPMGLRIHRVYLVRTLSEGVPGDGEQTTTETEIVEGGGHPPRVRQVGDEQRALGNLASGALLVGAITPGDSSVGLTVDELNGVGMVSGSETLRIRVEGPIGNNLYSLTKKEQASATRWMLTVEPVAAATE